MCKWLMQSPPPSLDERYLPPVVVRPFNRQELARLTPIRARAGVDEPIFKFIIIVIDEHSGRDEVHLRRMWLTYEAAYRRLGGRGQKALDAIYVVRTVGNDMAKVSDRNFSLHIRC